MREIKPKFYDEFQCIAGECTISCCKEWKIEVDDSTYKKWETLNIELQHVEQLDGVHVIKLDTNKKCPYLCEDKLCHLIKLHGDEVLSKTCTTFPREIREFKDRKEFSLASCCPTVIDFLNNEENIEFNMDLEKAEGDILFELRNFMLKCMQIKEYDTFKMLMMLYYILLELSERESITQADLKAYKNNNLFEELAQTIDKMEFSIIDTLEERNELFLDLVVNYRKEKLYTRHLEEIALYSERLYEIYNEEELLKKSKEFEIKMLPYEKLLCNYAVSQIFNSSLSMDSDIISMIAMFQWITLECVVIKHALFLYWLINKDETISYEVVRNYIVIISRMTGYTETDIFEYLENSFRDIIWDWGYLALIVGNNN